MALPFLPPASLDPAFTISGATEADIDAMAQVYYDAFALDPGNTWWWPPERDAMFEWMRARIQRKLANRNVRHFRVLNDQKELVAWARWDIPEGYEAQFGEWTGCSGAISDADASRQAVPRGSDPEVCEYFFAKLVHLSEKWNADEMLGLSLISTSPKYHRRGAAKALLTPMLALADAANLRSYVEATPAGRPIYEKLGFREAEAVRFDPDALTGGRVKGGVTLSIMIREPHPS